jgi:nicotinamide-nucleotide amidase
VGETRDTNAGDLARDLATAGVSVGRMSALPDRLDIVTAAFTEALGRADLVVATGGLGPTPDDLTREAVAAVTGESVRVDPTLEAWLRGLYERRAMAFPEVNLKQAWLIPSASIIPNPNGTAPGWWVDRPDGRVIVLLPGPPREMRPMWTGTVLPRLRDRGLGLRSVVRTLRLMGIGESLVAERLGEALLRSTNPIVATYARADAVDVRISAVSEPGGADPADLVAGAEREVRASIGEHVWGEGDVRWPAAIQAELEARGDDLAILEAGTRGAIAALLSEGVDGLRRAETVTDLPTATLDRAARELAERSGASVVLAARARPRRGDLALSVVVLRRGRLHRERRLVFLGGPLGRARAATASAAILLQQLRRS